MKMYNVTKLFAVMIGVIKLMTVVLMFSVVFISCGGEVTTDTEPEGEPGTSSTAFSCNNDADCELTGYNMLVASTEDCRDCPLAFCGGRAVSPEEAQIRREAFEEYCRGLDQEGDGFDYEEDLNCPTVD